MPIHALRKDREGFSQLLEGARYFALDTATKRPVQKLKGRRLPKTPPMSQQYGLLLPAGILVVDIDTHTDGAIEGQVAAMSRLLGVELQNTLTVVTRSGGRHFYLRVPKTVSLDKVPNGSLRHLEYILREQEGVEDVLGSRPLDTDFKLGKPHHVIYTVGAGSYNESGSYTWIDQPILEVPESGLQTFIEAKREHQNRSNIKKQASRKGRLRRASTAKSVDGEQQGNKHPESLSDCEELAEVHPSRFANLRASLKTLVKSYEGKASVLTYHAQRAHVFKLMQCCFNDRAIIQAWMLLRVDWDTYTNEQLPTHALLNDLERLRETFDEPEFHGVVCGKGKFNAAAVAEGTLDEGLTKLKSRVAHRKLSRRSTRASASPAAVVVDVAKARAMLIEVTRESSRQYEHAVMILRDLVQPIYNAGGDRVLGSRAFIQETLGLTSSQVGKALSVLRRSGVLEVRDHQRTGVASTYAVAHGLVHKELSETLTLERKFRQLGDDVFPAIIVDSETGGFVEAFTGKELSTGESPSELALEVAQQYCVDEAARREEIANGEYSMADWRDLLDAFEPESMHASSQMYADVEFDAASSVEVAVPAGDSSLADEFAGDSTADVRTPTHLHSRNLRCDERSSLESLTQIRGRDPAMLEAVP